MRASQLLTKTLRQDPSEAETISHRLMLRTGMIMQATAGVYSYLPLALRSLRKIEAILREEMDKAGGQEVRMPALQPIETWAQTGRDKAFGDNLFQLSDRRDRGLVLAPTHEEVITAIAKANVDSYRDLPRILYQIQTKFRDEPRPRAGLMRGREFDMKDAYSFDATDDSLGTTYERMRAAYRSIFRRCGLPTIEVEADSGAIGGKDSHEFIMPAESGEDTVLICQSTGYAANVERAVSIVPPNPKEEVRSIELIETPGQKTISDLAAFIGVNENQTLKAVFYQADNETILVAIRGDLEVNEVKLKNHVKAQQLRLSNPDEVLDAGLTAGSASPVGIKGVRVIADHTVQLGSNFVAGANEADRHYLNVNYPRDFEVDELTDIATARSGDMSIDGGGPLEAIRGIEVGHVFKLGSFFTEAIGASYLDEHGQLRPIIMGCYGIGVSRILAAAIEQNHDDKGIIFPAQIAPFHVHLLALNPQNPEVLTQATTIYEDLQAAGIEVLFDEREESAGVKFNDSDLLGLPVRLIVSPRNITNGVVEANRRRTGESWQIKYDDVIGTTTDLLSLDDL